MSAFSYKTKILTHSGLQIDPSKVTPLDIYGADIAYHLARELMFNGATKKEFSMAEYSLELAKKAAIIFPEDKNLRFKAMMSVAWCAYVKPLWYMTGKIVSEYNHQYVYPVKEAIEKRFGLLYSVEDHRRISYLNELCEQDAYMGKVVKWTGLYLSTEAREVLWLQDFTMHCKVPNVLTPGKQTELI